MKCSTKISVYSFWVIWNGLLYETIFRPDPQDLTLGCLYTIQPHFILILEIKGSSKLLSVVDSAFLKEEDAFFFRSNLAAVMYEEVIFLDQISLLNE